LVLKQSATESFLLLMKPCATRFLFLAVFLASQLSPRRFRERHFPLSPGFFNISPHALSFMIQKHCRGLILPKRTFSTAHFSRSSSPFHVRRFFSVGVMVFFILVQAILPWPSFKSRSKSPLPPILYSVCLGFALFFLPLPINNFLPFQIGGFPSSFSLVSLRQSGTSSVTLSPPGLTLPPPCMFFPSFSSHSRRLPFFEAPEIPFLRQTPPGLILPSPFKTMSLCKPHAFLCVSLPVNMENLKNGSVSFVFVESTMQIEPPSALFLFALAPSHK